MIPNDFVQTLLARVDIVEVIDRYVPLKKAGVNFAACCPFHHEKTPSFTVSPAKQFYHCFGCGAHGTAIGFLMEYGGKTFPDAVADLARDVGLEVPRVERPGEAERRSEAQDLAGLLLTAARYYRAQLKESPRAIDYLKERGLTGEIAARFGIGYAPDGWQPLASAFPHYDAPDLETAGLVIAGEGGKRYDRFRDRIMFPIHDGRGRSSGSAAGYWAPASPSTSIHPRHRSFPRAASSTASSSPATRSATKAGSSSSKATWTSSRSPSTGSPMSSPRSARQPPRRTCRSSSG
jgi:DNA primase